MVVYDSVYLFVGATLMCSLFLLDVAGFWSFLVSSLPNYRYYHACFPFNGFVFNASQFLFLFHRLRCLQVKQ